MPKKVRDAIVLEGMGRLELSLEDMQEIASDAARVIKKDRPPKKFIQDLERTKGHVTDRCLAIMHNGSGSWTYDLVYIGKISGRSEYYNDTIKKYTRRQAKKI